VKSRGSCVGGRAHELAQVTTSPSQAGAASDTWKISPTALKRAGGPPAIATPKTTRHRAGNRPPPTAHPQRDKPAYEPSPAPHGPRVNAALHYAGHARTAPYTTRATHEQRLTPRGPRTNIALRYMARARTRHYVTRSVPKPQHALQSPKASPAHAARSVRKDRQTQYKRQQG
jgi:hypothetical protein